MLAARGGPERVADDDEEAARLATEQLDRFPSVFEAAHARVLRAKLFLAREEDQPDLAHLAQPPRPEERVQHTFCGT